MSTVIETVTQYEDKALELLTKVQTDVLEYVKKVVDTLDARLPDFEIPDNEVLAQIPTLSEVVDTQFAFSKKLLASQEKFAKSLVKTVKPLTREGVKPAKAAAAKSAA